MRILIVYGSVFGQTRKIVEFVARCLRSRSHNVETRDAAESADPGGFDAVIVASPMRMGAYRPSIVRYVRRFKDGLAGKPSAFLSVSMAAANTVNRSQAMGELEKWVSRFRARTGWTPGQVHHAGGGVPYTRYDFLTRWIMKRIGQSQGYGTDTGRDYEYTDWDDLERFAAAFEAFAAAAAPRARAA